MIYTVTFNPSLDYIVKLEQFALGRVNRTEQEKMLPGGKGINVSIVLKNLGLESKCLGFIAGFIGEELERELINLGCNTEFVHVKQGITRINLKIKDKQETEINGIGPKISPDELEQLYKQLEDIKDGDSLVLAGSIPSSLPSNMYELIMQRLQGKNIQIIVDATKELLLKVLKYHPFLIKPNHHELGELFQVKLTKKEEIVTYAKKLKEQGARNVLVSMAGDGAILVDEQDKIYHLPAPKGKVKNSVGAGDSMVAGFLAGYEKHQDYEEAFRMGVATGSASAFSNELATKQEVELLLEAMS